MIPANKVADFFIILIYGSPLIVSFFIKGIIFSFILIASFVFYDLFDYNYFVQVNSLSFQFNSIHNILILFAMFCSCCMGILVHLFFLDLDKDIFLIIYNYDKILKSKVLKWILLLIINIIYISSIFLERYFYLKITGFQFISFIKFFTFIALPGIGLLSFYALIFIIWRLCVIKIKNKGILEENKIECDDEDDYDEDGDEDEDDDDQAEDLEVFWHKNK
ncbi:MAG: hypothetical protein LBR11_09480 [Deltaproteobacteria bacterium]|jgi:hypothetical protein|nr:hypothetical protein [Deltaproteobacteria bacterium]